jgi:hypothetical protein
MQPAEGEGLKVESRLLIASINHKASCWIGGPAALRKHHRALHWTVVNDKLLGGLHQLNWPKGPYCCSTRRYRVVQVFLAFNRFTSVIST